MSNWRMACFCGLIAAPFFSGCAAIENACSGKRTKLPQTDLSRNGEAPVMAQKEIYPKITRDSLSELISLGQVIVVDANGTGSFSERHIPDALNFEAVGPLWPKGLPKDRNALIVAYCGGPRCMAWKSPAQTLTRLGFGNVRHYPGGISEWEENRMTVERGSGRLNPIPPLNGKAESPIQSCKLSPTAQAARIKDLQSDLFSEITSIKEFEGALVLQFQDNPKNASSLTEFIRFEGQCCSSLRFALNSNQGYLQVEIRGPIEVLTAFKQVAQER